MKQFGGYDEAKKQAQVSGGPGRLPAGAYVCKVLGVKYENGQNGNSDMIRVQFDVAEGEFAGFFQKQYEANQNEDKKYKGNASIYVPKDDGSENDGWTKKSFAGWTNAFEESNKGYSWYWDEKKWKGKLIGIVFGETGTVIDGREIVYTEARFAVAADVVRNGNAPEAKFKAKNGYTGTGSGAGSSDGTPEFMKVPDSSLDELPFN